MKIVKWLENIWNLRLILDKYLPKIRQMSEALKAIQVQLEDLREAKFEVERELAKLKETSKGIPIEVVEDNVKPVVIDKYYDPQLGVEYVITEINGDKVSPDDDTVVE